MTDILEKPQNGCNICVFYYLFWPLTHCSVFSSALEVIQAFWVDFCHPVICCINKKLLNLDFYSIFQGGEGKNSMKHFFNVASGWPITSSTWPSWKIPYGACPIGGRPLLSRCPWQIAYSWEIWYAGPQRIRFSFGMANLTEDIGRAYFSIPWNWEKQLALPWTGDTLARRKLKVHVYAYWGLCREAYEPKEIRIWWSWECREVSVFFCCCHFRGFIPRAMTWME